MLMLSMVTMMMTMMMQQHQHQQRDAEADESPAHCPVTCPPPDIDSSDARMNLMITPPLCITSSCAYTNIHHHRLYDAPPLLDPAPSDEPEG